MGEPTQTTNSRRVRLGSWLQGLVGGKNQCKHPWWQPIGYERTDPRPLQAVVSPPIHTCEEVPTATAHCRMHRYRVPGGWLYHVQAAGTLSGMGLEYVPDVTEASHD